MRTVARLFLVPLVIALAGCGDDDVGEVIPDLEFDPVFTAIQSVVNPVAAVFEPYQNLQVAIDGLTEAGFVFDEVPAGTLGPLAQRSAGTETVLLPAEIPDSLLGSTLVFELISEDWVVDPDRTGAPADAVRLVYYAVDRFGTILFPLRERGVIDIYDADTGDEFSELRIVMTFQDGATEVTVADYTHGYIREGTAPVTDRFRGEGFYSDGDRVYFDLVGDNTISEDESADEPFTYELELDSGSALYRMDFSGITSNTGGESVLDLVAHMAYAGGLTIEAVINSVSEGDTAEEVTGVIRYNGEVVADIILDGATVTFLPPDGGVFSNAQLQELSQILQLLVQTGVQLLEQELPLLFT